MATTIRHRRIFFRDLELQVSIGIHEREKQAPQRVLINLDLDFEAPAPETHDDVANVLDYDKVRECIGALVEGRHFNLQETLCHEIVDALSAMPGIVRIRASTEKPDAYPDCRSVGYEAGFDVTSKR